MSVLRRRGGRLRPDVPGKATSLVASAAQLKRSDFGRARKGTAARQAWQDEAWRQYDINGEFAYGCSWVANSLSRVKLFIAEGDTDVPEPKRVEAGEAVEYLGALFNGPGGQSEMMRAFGLHLTVPGELYLVSYRDENDEQQWVTASIDELTKKSTKQIVLDRGDGKPIELRMSDPPERTDDFILRIWRSHGRRWWLADSPGHHVLPVLVELEALGKGVLATIDSRLAGAGLLLLPNELTFPDPPSEENAQHKDPFMATLIEAMVTPLQDRESAASVVPLVLRGPAEALDKAKLMTFGQNLDAATTPMREAALKRLAIGMDTPPEALLGFGDSNHWSAWQISEEAVKLSIEPLCATICDALTTGYLWPLLGGPSDQTIWYDASGLTQRPDRGPDAEAVFGVGELSAAAYRRERGFSEDDAPKGAERRERLLLTLLHGAPSLAPTLLPLIDWLGVTREDVAPIAPIPPGGQPALPPGDSPQDEPAGPPPDKPSGGDTPPAQHALPGGGKALSGSMLIACDLAVHRALEVAGKRMLDRHLRSKYQDTPTWLLHTYIDVTTDRCDYLLADAWTMFAEAAPELSYLSGALDEYVRTLLVRGLAHERQWLADVLREAVNRAAIPA